MTETNGLSPLDRPNSYIGRAVPRPDAARLARGGGRFVSDLALPRMLHVVFLRSPHAHARLLAIDTAPARALPGVVAVFTGADLVPHVRPWVGVLSHLKGLKSAPQYPLAIARACWQGEAVVAIVAESRALAEDAAELVVVDYEPLPALTDPEAALAPGALVLHPELGDNLAFERRLEAGAVDAAFAGADHVITETLSFGRHTGVTLEPRAVLAEWDPGAERLTVHQGTQAPHMLQNIYATQLGLAESQVRVICHDVGGSFGIKVHAYPDEMATVTLARLLARPVKFVADRLESFAADIHARDHRVTARIGVTQDGRITAFEIDDLTGIGPYSVYPRTSAVEANQVVNLVGAPYDFAHYRARARVVFQTKTPMSQYRAVGHPIATTVTESLVDRAAAALGLDPLEMRRRNLIADDAYPRTSATGLRFELLSHQAAHDKIAAMMDYPGLRAEQARLRGRGILRGIGFASFVEITNPGAAFYGVGGARISSQDGAVIRLDASGNVTVQSSVTEQGQGSATMIAQIAASALGVTMARVRVALGDTDTTPYGGGTWASRGAGIAGEAAWRAAAALRAEILAVAGAILQAAPESLDIAENVIIDRETRRARLDICELARIVHFRPDTLPAGMQAELIATRHYVPRDYPFAFTNGVQAAYLELDRETGAVTLLRHFVVEDCGRVINPRLVDEQIRGGVVQGLGAALLEHCRYDAEGQLQNANLADYLVPMATGMPDIEIAHLCSPTAESTIGAKGAGEAGTAGAAAAVLNAVNDALAPLGARVAALPITPESVVAAIRNRTAA